MDYVKDLLQAGTQMAGSGAKCVTDTLWRSLYIIHTNRWILCFNCIYLLGQFYVICKQIGLTFSLMLLLRLNEVWTVNYLVETYTWLLMLLMAAIYYCVNRSILRALYRFRGLLGVFIPVIGKLLKVLPQKIVPVGGAAAAGRTAAARSAAGNARRAAANNPQGNGGDLIGNAQPAGNVNPCLPRRNPDRFARTTVSYRYSPH